MAKGSVPRGPEDFVGRLLLGFLLVGCADKGHTAMEAPRCVPAASALSVESSQTWEPSAGPVYDGSLALFDL